MSRKLDALTRRLASSRTEEEVKAAWARHLRLEYDTSDDHDLSSRLTSPSSCACMRSRTAVSKGRTGWEGKDEMATLKAAHDALRDKLRLQLALFGFLDAGLIPPAADHTPHS